MHKCNFYSKVPAGIFEQIGHELWFYKYNFFQMHGCQKGIIDNKSPFSKST